MLKKAIYNMIFDPKVRDSNITVEQAEKDDLPNVTVTTMSQDDNNPLLRPLPMMLHPTQYTPLLGDSK